MDDQQQNGTQSTAPAAGMNGAQDKAKEAMHGLEAWLAPLFEKLPHIPQGGREWIVSVSPYIALVFGVLGIISLLGASGIGIIASVLTLGLAVPMMISIVISLVSAVLLLMAFPGLKARTKKGWNLVFYSEVISVAGGVITAFTMTYGSSIVGTAIGALIGFYILFEIRSYYK
jgi:hypothetical protein